MKRKTGLRVPAWGKSGVDIGSPVLLSTEAVVSETEKGN